MRSNQQDLFDTMKKSLTNQLKFALELFGNDKAKAVEYVQERTAAGRKVWEVVKKEMGLA